MSTLEPDLRVSVVIPTIGRPELRSTVASALAQTAHLHEVIVAADTADELDLPVDERVIVVRTGPRAGGNVARMTGIRRATAPLIALLDDDDLWTTEKLERQVAAVRRFLRSPIGDRPWISSTLLQEPNGRVWPQRRYQGERFPDYLFRKSRVKAGQGAIHTSTMLFPREFALAHPFDETLRFHQDTDWLVRVDSAARTTWLVQVEEPLTMLRIGSGSVSHGIRPRDSLAWARRAMKSVDRRTRGDFLVTVTYFQALRHHDIGAALCVLRSAFAWGPPTLRALPAIVILPLKLILKR